MNRFSRWNNIFLSFLGVKLPRSLRTPFLLAMLTSVTLILAFLVVDFSTQPVVPLFYSLGQPQDFLAAKEWLALFPIFSFTITILHATLLRYLRHYEQVIQLLFAWFTVVIQFLLALAMFRIIWIIS
jgi:hypothetical protein